MYNAVSEILKYVYFLVVNNNKYLSHVFDNIIFGINVPDYLIKSLKVSLYDHFRLFRFLVYNSTVEIDTL